MTVAAETFARSYGVERVVDTYADLVADPEVDVVYNPLANAFHAPWNLAAIQAGEAVLTEKPFARNAAEAEVVRGAAQTGNGDHGGIPLPVPPDHQAHVRPAC